MTWRLKDHVTKSDDKTHRFMDRNRPKGLRKNSVRDKKERRRMNHPATMNRKSQKHGRQNCC